MTTAEISAGQLQTSQDWYAWYFDRSEAYLQIEQDWYSWYFQRAPIQTGLEAESETIQALGEALFVLNGIESETEIGEPVTVADATNSQEGLELESQIDGINAVSSSNVLNEGLEIESEAGFVEIQTSSLQALEGLEALSEISEVTVNEGSSVVLTGIEASMSFGQVTAQGDESVIVVGPRSYRQPKQDATIKILGISVETETGLVLARGEIIINNVAKIYSIEASLDAKVVKARGVLNLTDEEIIILMAA